MLRSFSKILVACAKFLNQSECFKMTTTQFYAENIVIVSSLGLKI